MVVSNRAHFSGRILARLVNGFVPNVGDTFQVMSFATSRGDFVCEDGFIVLGQGRRLQKQFAATSLALVTLAAADPTGPRLGIHTANGAVAICWPSEFGAYRVQSNDDLTTTNWMTVGTNSFLVFPVEANVPQRYFRLIQP